MTFHRTCLTILACAACAAGEAGPPPTVGPPPPAGPPGMAPNHRPGPSPEEIFKAADADGDGKVTLAELTTHVEKRRQEERTRAFDAMDANHDGSVSKDEFLTFEPPAPPGGKEGKRRPGPDPEEMFKRFDKNGDGIITADEVVRHKGDGERGRGDKGDGPRPMPPVAP